MLNHFLLQQKARWGRCEKALGAAVMALAIALVSGCAPQQTTLDNVGTAESATVGTAATAFEWSPEADCATCHVKQASSTADAQCLASTHEDSACNSCHSDSEGLQNVHEGVASAEVELTRLKKTDIDSSYCLTCHDSYEALAGKTVDSQACTVISCTTVALPPIKLRASAAPVITRTFTSASPVTPDSSDNYSPSLAGPRSCGGRFTCGRKRAKASGHVLLIARSHMAGQALLNNIDFLSRDGA